MMMTTIFIQYVSAQEGHLTQFFNAVQYLNPAEAGAAKQARVVLNYRRQWPSIAAGYSTKVLGTDLNIKKFGYGLLLSSNDAGGGSLTRSKFMLNMARQLDLDSNNVLGFGLQAGFLQSRFNASSLKFDNQYGAGGFDRNQANGESFSNTSRVHFDGGFGLFWQNGKYSWKPKVSFSVGHLFKAKDSFYGNAESNALRQYTTFVEVSKQLSAKMELIPYLFYARQGKASNLLYGSRLGYSLKPEQTVYVGAAMRNKDAVLAYVGFTISQYLVGFSYDANISGLRTGTKGFGAWEISLSMRIKKKTKNGVVKEQTKESFPPVELDKDTAKVNEALPKKVVKSQVAVLGLDTLGKKPIAVIGAQMDSKTKKDSLLSSVKPIDYSTIDPNRIKHRYFIYFDIDKSVIKHSHKLELDQLVEQLKHHASYRILLHGHTDSDGDGLYNIYLGDARAHEVMKYLVEKGVPMSVIETFTYGKSSPAVDNTNEDAKSKNRRVELLLVQH